jgi:hypothetical protein
VAVRGLALGHADAYADPMSKAWVALAVIALVLLAVLGRYAVIPVSAPASGEESSWLASDQGQAVLLDRWTGKTRPVWTSPTIAYEVGKGWITWPDVLPPGVKLNREPAPQ